MQNQMKYPEKRNKRSGKVVKKIIKKMGTKKYIIKRKAYVVLRERKMEEKKECGIEQNR